MRRTTTEEQRTMERFQRYGRAASAAERALEQAGIGGVFASNGYTRIGQAGQLGRSLRLRRGQRLLDLGCGRGFPGLYLAQTTRCSVVGTDLPLASLRSAVRRAVRDRVSRRAAFVAASAVHLPFQRGSFDAIVHTDVLC